MCIIKNYQLLCNGVLTNGYIAICDTLNNRVQLFNYDGKYQSEFGSRGEDGYFWGPTKIVELDEGNIAILDDLSTRVQVFSFNPQHLMK